MKKGFDAPFGIIGLLVGTVFMFIGAFNAQSLFVWLAAFLMLFFSFTYFHTTWYGKYKIVKKAIQELQLPANTQALDIGTGHGLVLLEIAKYLKAPGKVIGIDIWSSKDQFQNSQAAAEQNIEQAGASDVAKVQTGNMLELPFPDNSFDLVTASLAIHNVKNKKERDRALAEAIRVLKPGGQLLIVDLIFGPEYQKTLAATNQFENINVKNVGYDGWWGGPWMTTTKLTATKKAQ